MKRKLSLLLCIALTLIAIPHPAQAAEEKVITFGIRDGITRTPIAANTVTYELYEHDGNQSPITVTATEESASASLIVGMRYDLKVSHQDYYSSNEQFTVQSEHGHIQFLMAKRADVTVVPEGAVSAVVVQNEAGATAVEVIIADTHLPEGLECDQFSIVLIPGTTYDVESDGLPKGMWEAPPEPMDWRRCESASPGEYVLVVGFFKTISGEYGPYRALTGYSMKSVNVGGAPGEGEARVVLTVIDYTTATPVEGASVRLDDGNHQFTAATDAAGRTAFTLVVDCNYDIQVEKDGYYKANGRFEASAGPMPAISLYKTEDLTQVPPSAISAEVHETGGPGVSVSVVTGELPDGFTPKEFAVVLIRQDPSWSVHTHGLPAGIWNAPPENLVETRHENINIEGDSEEVIIFVGFFEIVTGDHGDQREFTGYAVTQAVITPVSGGGDPGEDPGGDPGGGPGPGERLTIEWVSSDPEDAQSIEIDFNPGAPVHVVHVPDSSSGSITLPSELSSKPLTLLGLNAPFWADFSLDTFGGSIEGNVLTYTKPFGRIRLDVQLEGEPFPHEFIFCQPGYDIVELRFSLNGEPKYTMENDGTWEARHKAFELPPDLQSGTITVSGHLPGMGPDGPPEGAIGPVGGGVWEYLVDRSDYVTTTLDGRLIFQRHFGRVTVHYQYQIGNDWEGAMVTFYEPDFVGIDVLPEVGAGDWHTGIIDATESSVATLTPTAYVYFLNEKVFISASDVGRPFEITSATSPEEGVEVTYEEVGHERWAWAVTLPDVSKPVTRLNLALSFKDDDSTRVVPLDIKRVLLDAFTLMREGYEESGDPGTRQTPRQSDFEYYGYEEFIAFVSVTPYTETDQNDPNYFEIDHTLLVIYYKDDILLGTRQFQALAGPDSPRHEIPVFRKGAPQPGYADIASANRITAFLISKEGISADDNTFGGAVFGIGAGWGHLMPNHAEYGSGKDGMDYE